MKRVIIIGAGLSGATIARYLAENDFNVTVFEASDRVGGLCREIKIDGHIVSEFGPHIFHTNDERAWNFIRRFSEFIPYRHVVKSCVGLDYYQWPINLNTLKQVFGKMTTINEYEQIISEEVKEYFKNHSGDNFESKIVSQIGKTLYDMFVYGYTKKMWKREPRELKSSLAKRIEFRYNKINDFFTDKYQGLPKEGYSKLIERMLTYDKITIVTNCQVKYDDVKEDFKSVIVVTAPIDEFFNYKFGELEYRYTDFVFVKRGLARLAYPVINFPDENVPYFRATDYGYFWGGEIICLEFPAVEGTRAYPVPTLDNMNTAIQYLVEADIKNIYTLGRLGKYQYLNMDDAIIQALLLGAVIKEEFKYGI